MFRTKTVLLVRDHPRTRGEYCPTALMPSNKLGSPPHTRGILTATILKLEPKGITPAHAGNTYRGSGKSLVVWDHPRTRGEYL